MSIRLLPDDVIRKIKSSSSITCLNDVALGLVKNCLDASATTIAISVDYSRGNCTVEDNGEGIDPQEFEQDGGLGFCYYTSRYPPNLCYHGRHGTFLSSVATLSLMIITSQHLKQISQSSLCIHHGNLLTRSITAGAEQSDLMYSHGTRVSVNDLFGSMPVRVKRRSIQFIDRSAVDKEFTRLIRATVALLLSWHSAVTVTLRETKSQKGIKLQHLPFNKICTQVSHLLVQSGMINVEKLHEFIPVSASADGITIQGCISLQPVATRHCQLIAFEIDPLQNDYGTNVVFEEINKAFKESKFGLIQEHSGKDPSALDKFAQTGTRKGVDRWPVFYLQIKTPSNNSAVDTYNILDERNSKLSVILDLVKALSYGFLKRYNLEPRKLVKTNTKQKLEARKRVADRDQRSQVRPRSPFDPWYRGKTTSHAGSRHVKLSDHHQDNANLMVTSSNKAKALVPPVPLFDIESSMTEEDEQPRKVLATNTIKGLAFRNLGESQPRNKQGILPQEPSDNCESSALATAEICMPQITPYLASSVQPLNSQDRYYNIRASQVNVDDASMNSIGRISKTALGMAKVITQLDHKYILVHLPMAASTSETNDSQSSVLAVIDQHAADERCKLEELMENYFEPASMSASPKAVAQLLDRPIIFELPEDEWKVLCRRKQYLEYWGIIFNSTQPPSRNEDNAVTTISVTKLPPALVERCRSEPRVLIELLRQDICVVEDSPLLEPYQSRAMLSFRACPRGILDLLNSRACRSAIKFNDELSNSACQALVQRLANCTLPFQCAHGRPSLIPIIDLDQLEHIRPWKADGISPNRNAECWTKWATNC